MQVIQYLSGAWAIPVKKYDFSSPNFGVRKTNIFETTTYSMKRPVSSHQNYECFPILRVWWLFVAASHSWDDLPVVFAGFPTVSGGRSCNNIDGWWLLQKDTAIMEEILRRRTHLTNSGRATRWNKYILWGKTLLSLCGEIFLPQKAQEKHSPTWNLAFFSLSGSPKLARKARLGGSNQNESDVLVGKGRD